MEYSLSLVGYCSAALQVAPTQARRLNRPDRLPLSHPFSPQGQLFTMPRRLSIDNCIESRRTPYKKPKTSWRQFSNMRAKPSLDISAVGRFRIAKVDFPHGHYREYDVNPKIRGHSRDAERIVIEQDTGKAYYTADHYRTFTPLN